MYNWVELGIETATGKVTALIIAAVLVGLTTVQYITLSDAVVVACLAKVIEWVLLNNNKHCTKHSRICRGVCVLFLMLALVAMLPPLFNACICIFICVQAYSTNKNKNSGNLKELSTYDTFHI